MYAKPTSRREFIRMCVTGAAGIVLAGCAQAAPTPKPEEPAQAATAVPEPTAVPPTAQPEPVTLNLMDNWGGEADPKGKPLHEILADFQAANPDITIKEEVFTDEEIPVKVETAFLAGQEPDVVFENLYPRCRVWPDHGLTIPVTGLLSEWGVKDAFLPAALDLWTNEKGQVMGFPLEAFTWPMVYNTKILGAAGVEIPKTTDELLAAIPKIRAAGFQPLVVGGNCWMGYAQAALIVETMLKPEQALDLYMRGGFDQDPAAVAAWELFIQLRDAKLFADDSPGLDDAGANANFIAGKAAMIHWGSWSYSLAPVDMAADLTLAGFPLPAGSPHAQPIIMAGFDAKAVWITRNGAKKLDAVKKLVQFLYQPEMMARFAEESSMPLPIKSPPVDASKLHPLFAQSLQFTEDMVTMVPAAQGQAPNAVRPAFINTTMEAYVGKLTAQDILSRLVEAYKAQ